MRVAAMIVLLMAGTAWGQAAPATQPASDYPALRRKLAELTETVKRLTAENQQLREQLAAAQRIAGTTRPAVGRSNITLATIDRLVGMTLDEAKEALGKPWHGPYLMGAAVGGRQYRWGIDHADGSSSSIIVVVQDERVVSVTHPESMDEAPRRAPAVEVRGRR